MLLLSAAKASSELSRIWYWWWHAGGMLGSKRVRVATRAWWRAGWQWWCPLCYDDGNASRALYNASASKLRLLVKAMRLVSCRHIVEAVVLNVAVVVARSQPRIVKGSLTNNYYIAKSNVLLDFYNSIPTYTLVAPTTEFSFPCQVYFRRGVVSVCYFSPEKNLHKISAVLDLEEQSLFV